MSTVDCDHCRGLLALRVIGQLAEDDALILSAHLDGCPECRQEAADLVSLAAALPAADLAHLNGYEMPVELEKAVLFGLESQARHDRHRRRLRYAVAGAVAAGAIAIAVVLTTVVSTGAGQTVALTGEHGVQASVRLTSESWGTAVDLEESGQPGGEVLTVAMRTTTGKWWTAGTYRTVAGRDVRVTMACALRITDIETVWVKNRAGHTVLQGYVN